jgi:glycosyltransferase involved in cell wall biosynthesis
MMFSIVVPTYECAGRAVELLSDLFESIEAQSFRDFEVVIADHSKDTAVRDFARRQPFPVVYLANDRGRGNSSINMNEGIKISRGKYIKVMHMDDLFCNDRSLEQIADAIQKNPDKRWGGVGFNHLDEDQGVVRDFRMPGIIPEFQALLGCPSVSFFLNDQESPNLFNEELVVINDAEMHYRLQKKYGDPILIEDYCVTVRLSAGQVTNIIGRKRHDSELEYYYSKVLGKT